MIDKFHDELESLKRDAAGYARFSREMLSGSMDALMANDERIAAAVKERKQELGERHAALEERIFQDIALYQPVAKDMRTVACCLQVVGDSLRIGRYGKDIANIVRAIHGRPMFGSLSSISHMSDLVLAMIDDATLAFENEDLSLIDGMSARDDVVDGLRATILRECLTYMMEDPATISRGINYIMLARYLERCADHACKIAEKVQYMATGERIEIR